MTALRERVSSRSSWTRPTTGRSTGRRRSASAGPSRGPAATACESGGAGPAPDRRSVGPGPVRPRHLHRRRDVIPGGAPPPGRVIRGSGSYLGPLIMCSEHLRRVRRRAAVRRGDDDALTTLHAARRRQGVHQPLQYSGGLGIVSGDHLWARPVSPAWGLGPRGLELVDELAALGLLRHHNKPTIAAGLACRATP